MVTSETAILYIGYKQNELINSFFLSAKLERKFIAEFDNWKFTLTTLNLKNANNNSYSNGYEQGWKFAGNAK